MRREEWSDRRLVRKRSGDSDKLTRVANPHLTFTQMIPRDWQQILSKKHNPEPEASVTSHLQLVNINPTTLEAVMTNKIKPHLQRCKNWSEREEARLVGELRKGLGRQIVDR